VAGCAFTGDGMSVLLLQSDRRISIRDAVTGQEQRGIAAAMSPGIANVLTNRSTSVVFSPDRACVAVLGAKGLGVYSVADGQPRFEHTFNSPPARATLKLLFSPDSSQIVLACTLTDPVLPAVLVLDAQTGVTAWQDNADQVGDIAVIGDGGRIAAAGTASAGRGYVRVYEVGVPVLSRTPCGGPVNPVAISTAAAGVLAVAAQPPAAVTTVSIVRSESGASMMELPHPGAVPSLAVSPDGRSVATASTTEARLFDPIAGPIWRAHHGDRVNVVAFSADGQHVATASEDGTARLYAHLLAAGEDLDTHQPLWAAPHPNAVTHLALSPDGRLAATGCLDRNTRILDGTTGATLHTYELDDKVRTLAFSPTGSQLATAGATTVLVIDTATGSQRHTLVHPQSVTALSFSPDGSLLATAARDNTVRVWAIDVPQPQTVWTRTQPAQITDIVFSPVGELLAVVLADPIVRMANPTTGVEVMRLIHPQKVRAVAFSPDGVLCATGCDDHVARVFRVRQP
jgi:WD40 repeat protein